MVKSLVGGPWGEAPAPSTESNPDIAAFLPPETVSTFAICQQTPTVGPPRQTYRENPRPADLSGASNVLSSPRSVSGIGGSGIGAPLGVHGVPR